MDYSSIMQDIYGEHRLEDTEDNPKYSISEIPCPDNPSIIFKIKKPLIQFSDDEKDSIKSYTPTFQEKIPVAKENVSKDNPVKNTEKINLPPRSYGENKPAPQSNIMTEHSSDKKCESEPMPQDTSKHSQEQPKLLIIRLPGDPEAAKKYSENTQNNFEYKEYSKIAVEETRSKAQASFSSQKSTDKKGKCRNCLNSGIVNFSCGHSCCKGCALLVYNTRRCNTCNKDISKDISSIKDMVFRYL